jgi:hypothetical protein
MDSSTIMVGRYPISICMACVLHVIWAVGLWVEPASIHATGLYTVMVIARDTTIAALIFAGVAVLATIGLASKRHAVQVAMILPQQIVLWFSVVGALHAMYLGQFADGVQRAHWFLIVDQVPVVLITLGHTAALIFIAERRNAGV